MVAPIAERGGKTEWYLIGVHLFLIGSVQREREELERKIDSMEKREGEVTQRGRERREMEYRSQKLPW